MRPSVFLFAFALGLLPACHGSTEDLGSTSSGSAGAGGAGAGGSGASGGDAGTSGHPSMMPPPSDSRAPFPAGALFTNVFGSSLLRTTYGAEKDPYYCATHLDFSVCKAVAPIDHQTNHLVVDQDGAPVLASYAQALLARPRRQSARGRCSIPRR